MRFFAIFAAACVCLTFAATARSGTKHVSILEQRQERQVRALHRYVGTVRFFRRHRWLVRFQPSRPVALRALHVAHVWIPVIRRELAETRAALRPRRVVAFGGVPSWFVADALCVHSGWRGNVRVGSGEGAWNAATGNGFYGGMQFLQSTWESVGGRGSPADASPAEQIYRSYLLWKQQGWNPWPNTARACGLL